MKCDDFKFTPFQTYNMDSDDKIPSEVDELLTQKGAAKDVGEQNVDVQEDVVVGDSVGGDKEMDGEAIDDHNAKRDTQTIYEAIDDIQGVPSASDGEGGEAVVADGE